MIALALSFAVGGILSVGIYRYWVGGNDANSLHSAENPIPNPVPDTTAISSTLQLYMQEWEVVIETQRHFNDLIVKYRSMTLTVFVALLGAVITVSQKRDLYEPVASRLFWLPAVFWVASAFLDLAYYHRLLLGAVAQGAKFDASAATKQYGLFGLSKSIQNHVRPRAAKVNVLLYYGGTGIVAALIARSLW